MEVCADIQKQTMMKLSFSDKLRILGSPKKEMVIEIHSNDNYSLYFTNDVMKYPRHEILNGIHYHVEDARLELQTYGELISIDADKTQH